MKVTVLGILSDRDGHARDYAGRHWATPSTAYRAVQDPHIRIDTDHDHRQVGDVVHLEIDSYARLWAVAEVDQDAINPFVRVRVGDDIVRVPSDLYWSAERIVDDIDDAALLTWVSLTTRPARVAPDPVEIYPTSIHIDAPARVPWTRRALVRNAVTARHQRQAARGPILIRNATTAHTLPADTSPDEPLPGDRPADALWYGQSGRILAVH